MADSDLFKQVDFVVESVQALRNRRSGLLRIRQQLLKVRKPTTFKNQEMASIIADMFVDTFTFADMYTSSVRRTMDYQPGTDFHEAHDMFHIPGSGSKNPEYSNF